MHTAATLQLDRGIAMLTTPEPTTTLDPKVIGAILTVGAACIAAFARYVFGPIGNKVCRTFLRGEMEELAKLRPLVEANGRRLEDSDRAHAVVEERFAEAHERVATAVERIEVNMKTESEGRHSLAARVSALEAIAGHRRVGDML